MCSKNSIQTGLGSNSLPTTIEQFDVGFTDASNQITVQVDIRDMSAADDFGVVQLEVHTVGDGFVHQSFDLTHGLSREWFGGGRSLPPDETKITDLAGARSSA